MLTWSDALVDGKRYIKTNYSIDTKPAFDFEVLKGKFEQRKLATLIAGDKGSSHPFELYSHRVRTIRWFEATAPQDFDLYGQGWSSAMFPSYRGSTADKLATLSQYRFAICYENASNIPGYITEKMLDCLRAGVVPVYGGAPNISRWVPEDCFIHIGDFSSYFDLYERLRSMDAQTHAQYLDNMASFLGGPKSYPFSSSCFVHTMEQLISFDVATCRHQAGEHGYEAVAGWDMVQDIQTTMMVGLVAQEQAKPALPQSQRALREAIAQTRSPHLVVLICYGDELPVFRRARALWEFYLQHFPQIKVYFMSHTDELPVGQVIEQGNNLIVGSAETQSSDLREQGYEDSGVWSTKQNKAQIWRQIGAHRHLLKKIEGPFFTYHSTVTSIVDFRGLVAVLEHMPHTGCFAGMPGRMTSPAELSGLGFVCGTNSLFSRDILELMSSRHLPEHESTHWPQDVWQALVLHDVPRLSLPFFSFTEPRAVGEQLEEVERITQRLLADGHFHFRIKTSSAGKGLGNREDVDPWIMLKVMETILSSPGPTKKAYSLTGDLHHFTCGANEGFSAYPPDPFLGGRERNFPLCDAEAVSLYQIKRTSGA